LLTLLTSLLTCLQVAETGTGYQPTAALGGRKRPNTEPDDDDGRQLQAKHARCQSASAADHSASQREEPCTSAGIYVCPPVVHIIPSDSSFPDFNASGESAQGPSRRKKISYFDTLIDTNDQSWQ